MKAVDGVDFELYKGETLGIVGESGSGKSVMALSIVRLLQSPGRIVGGEVWYRGRDLVKLPQHEMEKIRGAEIAMIFQDPMTSLNPVYRVGWQVAEPLRLHKKLDKRTSLIEAIRMLQLVGIPDAAQRARNFPHEFSGGMRQRAMIAMGLTTQPSVLIADEPTTSLDVTIQAQILELLKRINEELGAATILISHNLGVVAGMCERLMVMYAGRVVEHGLTEEVFAHPKHPYTWSLLRSMPRLDAQAHLPLQAIEGMPPDPASMPDGCRFHPRCQFAVERCRHDEPALAPITQTHSAACWVTQNGGELSAQARSGTVG